MKKQKFLTGVLACTMALGMVGCSTDRELVENVKSSTNDESTSLNVSGDAPVSQDTSTAKTMTVDGYSIEVPETLVFMENNNDVSRFFGQGTDSTTSVPHMIAENQHYVSFTVGNETEEGMALYLEEVKSVIQEISEPENDLSVEFEVIDENTEFTAKSGEKFQYICHYLMANDENSTEPCAFTMVFAHETGNILVDATCDTSADTEVLKRLILDMMATIIIDDSGLKMPVVNGEFVGTRPVFTD